MYTNDYSIIMNETIAGKKKSKIHKNTHNNQTHLKYEHNYIYMHNCMKMIWCTCHGKSITALFIN